jgi:competence protein ComEA
MFTGRLAKLAAMSTLMSLVLAGVGTVTTGQTTTAQPKVKAKAKEKAKAVAPAPLDLNKASEKELVEQLPGVGEVTAKKIVAGRPYTKVDDLAKAGVSAKTIDGIRSVVTVSPPPAPAVVEAPAKPKMAAKNAAPTAEPAVSTAPATAKSKAATKAARLAPGQRVNLNTASKEELDILPGIGPVRAQAIIDGRPYKTIDDIKKVKGIKEFEFSQIKDIITVK